MTHTDIVDNWLQRLAASAGLDTLRLDERGCAALRYHDDVDLLLELPEGSPVLQVYSPLLRLPGEPVEQAALLRRLLAANLFALETRGASFALDEHNQRVQLQCQIPLADTDADRFVQQFGNFAEAAAHWKQELGVEAASATQEAPAPADPFSMRV